MGEIPHNEVALGLIVCLQPQAGMQCLQKSLVVPVGRVGFDA